MTHIDYPTRWNRARRVPAQALGAADCASVLETGHVILSGTQAEPLQDRQVRAAFLGTC